MGNVDGKDSNLNYPAVQKNKTAFNKLEAVKKKINNRVLSDAFKKLRNQIKAKAKSDDIKKLKPLLQKLLNRTDLNYKLINEAHFFELWRKYIANHKKEESKSKAFRNGVMNKYLKKSVIKRNNDQLRKRFLYWANLNDQQKRNDKKEKLDKEKENDSKEAKKNLEKNAAKFTDLLANLCKKNIAKSWRCPY